MQTAEDAVSAEQKAAKSKRVVVWKDGGAYEDCVVPDEYIMGK